MVPEENIQANDRSVEEEEKLNEDMEKPHIDVNMSERTAEEEDDKKFQVLIDQEENVAWHDATYESTQETM